MSTIMQLLGSHPYTAEALQRQLVSGAGPFTITASHVRTSTVLGAKSPLVREQASGCCICMWPAPQLGRCSVVPVVHARQSVTAGKMVALGTHGCPDDGMRGHKRGRTLVQNEDCPLAGNRGLIMLRVSWCQGDAGGTSAAQADSGSGGGGGGDAEQSGGGNAGMSDEAVQRKRLAATQEKNRRNQRKYRERQKARTAPPLPSCCRGDDIGQIPVE